MEALYASFNIIGPAVLIAVIIFFTLRTRKQSAQDKKRSDEGARELREQLNREDTQRPNGSR